MYIENLLRSLNARDVRYVIIGATAFPVHGYARATLDVDFFIEPTEENARNTWAALRDFGYDVTDLAVKDLLTNEILIRQYWLETDIHPFAAGSPSIRCGPTGWRVPSGRHGLGLPAWTI